MRKLAKFGALLVVLGLAALGTGVFAQDPPVNSHDKHFVTDAAEGGLAEVELGQLAQSKAHSDKVKDFAQKAVDDHSKTNQELKECVLRLTLNKREEVKPRKVEIK